MKNIADWQRTNNLPLWKVIKHDELFENYPEMRDVDIQLDERMFWGWELIISKEWLPIIKINPNTNDFNKTLLHEIQHLIQVKEFFSTWWSPNSMTKIMKEKISNLNKDYRKEWDKLTDIKDRRDFWEWEFLIDKPNPTNKDLVKAENILKSNKNIKKLSDISKETIENQIKFARESDYELYNSLKWEVESRNVEARKDMTKEERKNTPLSKTEDVKKWEQLSYKDEDPTTMYEMEMEKKRLKQELKDFNKDNADSFIKRNEDPETNFKNREKKWGWLQDKQQELLKKIRDLDSNRKRFVDKIEGMGSKKMDSKSRNDKYQHEDTKDIIEQLEEYPNDTIYSADDTPYTIDDIDSLKETLWELEPKVIKYEKPVYHWWDFKSFQNLDAWFKFKSWLVWKEVEIGRVAQEWPWIYTTSNKSDALGYWEDIMKLEKSVGANIVDENTTLLTKRQIQRAVNNFDEQAKKDIAENWDENYTKWLSDAIDSFVWGKTVHEQIMNLWGDVFQRRDVDGFMKFVDDLGIDWVNIERWENFHTVIYNKDAFKNVPTNVLWKEEIAKYIKPKTKEEVANIMKQHEKDLWNVINTDDFRRYFWEKDGVSASDNQKSSSSLARDYEDYIFNKPENKWKKVVVLWGGAGSGKSWTQKVMKESYDNPIIIDTSLSKWINRINNINARWFEDITVAYTHTDFIEAMKRAIGRTIKNKERRVLPFSYGSKAHKWARETILEELWKFPDGVSIRVFDNSGKEKDFWEITMKKLKEYASNPKNEIPDLKTVEWKEKFKNVYSELDKQHKAWRLTDIEYNQFLQSALVLVMLWGVWGSLESK